jgi:hypothetical protein
MSTGSRVLIMGLRGSGKTSYLAALWHLVEAGELPTALVAAELQPDRQYLNRIRDSWLTFQPVGRTSLRSQEVISLILRDAVSDEAIDLSLPDLSGELFALHWATRKASAFYADLASASSGILLFLHADSVRRSSRISPESVKGSKATDEVSGGVHESTEWTPDATPTQVQLVEMLQFSLFLQTALQTRIAVVVSAWDLIREPVIPSAWLESQLPLLSQFLTSNAREVPFRVYGVSAQGGDLEKDITRLQAETVPAKRIRIVGETLLPDNDLTAPLRYLLERN